MVYAVRSDPATIATPLQSPHSANFTTYASTTTMQEPRTRLHRPHICETRDAAETATEQLGATLYHPLPNSAPTTRNNIPLAEQEWGKIKHKWIYIERVRLLQGSERRLRLLQNKKDARKGTNLKRLLPLQYSDNRLRMLQNKKELLLQK